MSEQKETAILQKKEGTFAVKPERFTFAARDKTEISAVKWIPDKEPKALLQIVHGMNEHVMRHALLANFFAARDFVVFGEDHRGHGVTAKGNFGCFDDKDGAAKVIEDNFELTKLMKSQYPNKKIFLFGHSMGSFISRNYVFKHGNEIDGLILTGSGGFSTIDKILILLCVKFLLLFIPPRAKMKFANKIGARRFNKKCRPAKTDYDWFSTLPEAAEEFIRDPLCAKVNTLGFFRDGIKLIIEMEKKKNIANVPKSLPIFLLSGSMDPVGIYGKKVTQAYRDYLEAGVKDVSIKLYDGMRHELHNEPIRDQFFTTLLNWIEERI